MSKEEFISTKSLSNSVIKILLSSLSNIIGLNLHFLISNVKICEDFLKNNVPGISI